GRRTWRYGQCDLSWICADAFGSKPDPRNGKGTWPNRGTGDKRCASARPADQEVRYNRGNRGLRGVLVHRGWRLHYWRGVAGRRGWTAQLASRRSPWMGCLATPLAQVHGRRISSVYNVQ